MSLTARQRDYWDFFIDECVRQKAPLYERLARGIRDDPLLHTLAKRAKPGQPMANLILGAVHYLLLSGTSHELSQYYQTINREILTPGGDPFPLFCEFCAKHETEIARLIENRITNTNEVGRSAYLRAGFLKISQEGAGPLHLIEIGPSAGLNLHWDRYAYRYVADGMTFRAGASGSGLELETELFGPLRPPMGDTPAIGLCCGLERDPVDLSEPGDRLWLQALVWPDHLHRFRRLERALEETKGLALDIRRGDALALLPETLSRAPRGGTVVIFHTLTTYQFAKDERQALNDILTLASVRRPLWRLSLEWGDGVYPLKLSHYRDGAEKTRILAICDPQGGAMEWRDEKSP